MLPLVFIVTSLILVRCSLLFRDTVIASAVLFCGFTSLAYWKEPTDSGFDSSAFRCPRLVVDYIAAVIMAVVVGVRVFPFASWATKLVALCTLVAFAYSNTLGYHGPTPTQRTIHLLGHISTIVLLVSCSQDMSTPRVTMRK